MEAIRDYIARDSETYADALLLEFFESVEQLEKFPRSGRIVPEENTPEIRELIVGNYRLIYEITDANVQILTVVHGARRYRRRS